MTSNQEQIPAANVARFDEAASGWEDNPQRVALARGVAEAIRQAVPLAGTMRVLEYGCGTGLVSRALSRLVLKIMAVDTSPQMLEVLNRKAGEEKIGNIETRVHNLIRQPLPDKDFDLIMCSMTLHHIPDIETLLHRFFAALKPGGYLALADLLTEDGSFHDDNRGVAHHGIDPEALRAMLAKNGGLEIAFKEVQVIEKKLKDGEIPARYPVFLAWCRKESHAS